MQSKLNELRVYKQQITDFLEEGDFYIVAEYALHAVLLNCNEADAQKIREMLKMLEMLDV